MLRLLHLLLAFSLAISGLARAQDSGPADESRRVIYRGVTLIDGTGSAPQAGMAVITKGERIESVLPAARVTGSMTKSAQIVDLSGRYLLPGLIDSHQHFVPPSDRRRAEAVLRRQLYSGVTATRIMAGDLRLVADLDRVARIGEIASPDLYFAAVVAGPSFFGDPRVRAASAGWTPGEAPWAQAIDKSTDIPLAIARARGTGASALKIYSDLPPHLVRRLTEEAHRQKLPVWAHAMVFPTSPAEVIAAGPDVISHTCPVAYQVMEKRPQRFHEHRLPFDTAPFAVGDNPITAELFRDMRRRGIILDATLFVVRAVERRSVASGKRPNCPLDLAARLTAQAHREGVLISAGSDGETPLDAPYPAMFDELELLVSRSGLTPLEAIRSATQIGAMSIAKGNGLGAVAPGYVANLVVLERDPAADIANMRSVLFTVKRGRRFDRSDYRSTGAGESGR